MQIAKYKNQKYPKSIGIIASGIMLSGLFFAFPHLAWAARLYLVHQPDAPSLGDNVTVSLMLDPQGSAVNAAEATIAFDGPVNLQTMRDADSIVGQWIARDATTTANTANVVTVSGIIPGGYSGNLSAYWEGERPGKIIDFVFRANGDGNASFAIKNASVLLNDGKGTAAPVQVTGDSVVVGMPPASGGATQEKSYTPVDVIPPDVFTPVIGRDPLVFNGNYFVSFATRDNDTGVADYAVAESPRSVNASGYASLPWRPATSPYQLADQSLQSYVYVKAIDGAGNMRVAVLPPTASFSTVNYLGGWGMIALILFGFVCLIGWYILMQKKRYAAR